MRQTEIQRKIAEADSRDEIRKEIWKCEIKASIPIFAGIGVFIFTAVNAPNDLGVFAFAFVLVIIGSVHGNRASRLKQEYRKGKRQCDDDTEERTESTPRTASSIPTEQINIECPDNSTCTGVKVSIQPQCDDSGREACTEPTSRTDSTSTSRYADKTSDRQPETSIDGDVLRRVFPVNERTARPTTCENPNDDCYRKPVTEVKWTPSADQTDTHRDWLCKPCCDALTTN